MTKKRDRLQELADIRARQPELRSFAVERQLWKIHHLTTLLTPSQSEAWKYVAIGAVTCLENTFRWAIQHLVDFGTPFSVNATKLTDHKFDIREILAIQGKSHTAGELIAHLVSINNLNDIVALMSALFGEDFLCLLKSSRILPFQDTPTIYLEKPEVAIPAVEEIFRLRHIFCHEIAESDVIDTADITTKFHSAHDFIEASIDLVLDRTEVHSRHIDQFSRRTLVGTKRSEAKEALRAAIERCGAAFFEAETALYMTRYDGANGGPYFQDLFQIKLLTARTQQIETMIKYPDTWGDLP